MSLLFFVQLAYVIFSLMVLFGLDETDSMEAPIEGEDYDSMLDWIGGWRPFFGMVLFTLFILYGLVVK